MLSNGIIILPNKAPQNPPINDCVKLCFWLIPFCILLLLFPEPNVFPVFPEPNVEPEPPDPKELELPDPNVLPPEPNELFPDWLFPPNLRR